MPKKTIIIAAILIVLIALFAYFTSSKKVQAPTDNNNTQTTIAPSVLSTKYITNLETWPPVVIVKANPYTCNKGGSAIEMGGTTSEKQINGRVYCLTVASEGAAGSTYNNYTYTTKIGANVAQTSFVLRYVQCMNYDDPKQTECKNEQATFNPDVVVSSVIENYVKTQNISTQPIEIKVSNGSVTGHINIGPFCPVQIEGHPCPVPPEAYSSRKVLVYESNSTTVKEKVNIDSKGDYKVTLTPGTYFLQVDPAGIGAGEKKKVVVVASKTSTVDFDIDTGMR